MNLLTGISLVRLHCTSNFTFQHSTTMNPKACIALTLTACALTSVTGQLITIAAAGTAVAAGTLLVTPAAATAIGAIILGGGAILKGLAIAGIAGKNA